MAPFGVVVHRERLALPELLPGSAVSGSVELDRVPSLGLVEAELVVTAEGVEARTSGDDESEELLAGLRA
ncbi:hypothetical protein [Nocardioides solisilvae]|uniref:hypothetical protein n=1 Tax=Nocardioides solisilvae TaxID=1542435 RepID=UPI000D74742B|nr:hypothetical protein [Nocardioides solisilvae]